MVVFDMGPSEDTVDEFVDSEGDYDDCEVSTVEVEATAEASYEEVTGIAGFVSASYEELTYSDATVDASECNNSEIDTC